MQLSYWRRKTEKKNLEFQNEVAEMLKKIFNQNRKSHLFQESQLQKSMEIEGRISTQFEQIQIIQNEWRNKGVFLKEDDVLFFFDQLAKVNESLETANENIFLNSLYQRMFTMTGWKSIAQRSLPYDSLGMEVVGSMESPEPKGTVIQIINQGFTRPDGSVVRKAKVIASNGIEEKDLLYTNLSLELNFRQEQ